MVQWARDHRDGEVGDGLVGRQEEVQVQEEVQEGEGQEGRQEEVQVQEEEVQEGEGAPLRVRRLGGIVGGGEVLAAVRR